MKLTPAQIKALRLYADPRQINLPPHGMVRRDVYDKLARLGLLTSVGPYGITAAGEAALAEIDRPT